MFDVRNNVAAQVHNPDPPYCPIQDRAQQFTIRLAPQLHMHSSEAGNKWIFYSHFSVQHKSIRIFASVERQWVHMDYTIYTHRQTHAQYTYKQTHTSTFHLKISLI